MSCLVTAVLEFTECFLCFLLVTHRSGVKYKYKTLFSSDSSALPPGPPPPSEAATATS